jgi:hypothetical protein
LKQPPLPKSSTKPTAKTKNKTKPKNKPKPKPEPEPKSTKPSFESTPSEPPEVKLRASKDPTDPGGTIDRTAQRDQTYHYTAQRIRTVVLPGSTLAGHKLELRSSISSPITLLMRDTFPPAPPTGLAAIPSGLTPADRSIDLSWEPNAESDLAGYSVYRQQISSTGDFTGPSTRLTATPVIGPSFRDQTAAPGQRYAYRVTAVDSSGNESAPSADVQEILREQ